MRKPLAFERPERRRSHDFDPLPPSGGAAMANSALRRSPEANSAAADPDAQSKARKLALACDFSAWKVREWKRHRRQATIEDLHQAVRRVAGSTVPSLSQFRRFFEHNAERRDMPARLERAFVIVTGGEALAAFHRELHGEEPEAPASPEREILDGMEEAA